MTNLDTLLPGTLVERSDWGVTATPGGATRDRDEVVGFTQHHTTGNALGNPDTTRWVKNIYDYHVETLGWADIGYAYLYDKHGNVFVGRGRFRTLAHARGFNRTWLGVAYLGSGVEEQLTREAKLAGRALHDWLASDGGMTNMRDIKGHRDQGDTACPGSYLYQWAVELKMPKPEELHVGRFSDVPEDHPFFDDIEELAQDGVVHGYQDGTYRPEEPMTRAQVASLINRTRNS